MPDTTPEPASGPPPDATAELTGRQEARVRRLLAEARVDEPVPADVAARLDSVLADLSRERSRAADDTADGTDPGPVDLLARRRRRVGRLLLAAAAAVVVVLGAARLVQDVTQGQGAGSSASSAASDRAGAGSGTESFEAPVGPGARRAYAAASVPALRPGAFRADVARARSTGSGPGAPGGGSGADARTTRALRACAPDRAGAGVLVPVRYAGRPAVLVLRPPARGSQVADLYLCRAAAVARSVTLPAP